MQGTTVGVAYALLGGGEQSAAVPGSQLHLEPLVRVVAAEQGLDALHGGFHRPPATGHVKQGQRHHTQRVVAAGTHTTCAQCSNGNGKLTALVHWPHPGSHRELCRCDPTGAPAVCSW